MESISAERMREQIDVLLPQEDMTATSVRQLRAKLEVALGLAEGDLEPRKDEVHALIQEEVIRFLQPNGSEGEEPVDAEGEVSGEEVDDEERKRLREERRAARRARREAREERRQKGLGRKAKIAIFKGKKSGLPSGSFSKVRFAGKGVIKKATAPGVKKPQGPKERKLEAVPEAERQDLWDKWLASHGDVPLAELPDLPGVWGYEDVGTGAQSATTEEKLDPMDTDAADKTQTMQNPMSKLASPMRSRLPDPTKTLDFELEAVAQ